MGSTGDPRGREQMTEPGSAPPPAPALPVPPEVRHVSGFEREVQGMSVGDTDEPAHRA